MYKSLLACPLCMNMFKTQYPHLYVHGKKSK